MIMKTIKLQAKDFKDYKYIGKFELHTYQDFNIEIEGGLGYVFFEKGIYVNGYIVAQAGSGIEAGEVIKAGEGIEDGEGIKAGACIEAGEGIKAGSGIEAGEGIKAGEGISAGLSIRCNLTIKWAYNLFAGIAWWKKAEKEDI